MKCTQTNNKGNEFDKFQKENQIRLCSVITIEIYRHVQCTDDGKTLCKSEFSSHR